MDVKFNKSFEALYAVAMKLADECIVNKPMEKRFEKLEEEYHELIDDFDKLLKFEKSGQEFVDGKNHADHINNLRGELSDVLFVLLHIANKLGLTAFDLLHLASSKMLKRMNDANYIAKN